MNLIFYICIPICEGSPLRCLLESVGWSCVGAQVKDGSHVVIWMACKRRHSQYETRCGFRPIHENNYTLLEALTALV